LGATSTYLALEWWNSSSFTVIFDKLILTPILGTVITILPFVIGPNKYLLELEWRINSSNMAIAANYGKPTADKLTQEHAKAMTAAKNTGLSVLCNTMAIVNNILEDYMSLIFVSLWLYLLVVSVRQSGKISQPTG
jgi:hypothetical protein